MGSKGSTTNTTQASTYDPTGSNWLTQALGQASSAASNPYQSYGGELTAGMNGQENTAIGNINSAYGAAQPAYNQAMGMLGSASQPISQSQISQYESPYTSQVVNATQAQFNQQNAQQQSQVTGNAALQGALGGDRVGVAQANTAAQQQTAQAPVIAGLENQGYQTALSTAQQQQQNQENAALGMGSLGTGLQNSLLSGASAQLGAGQLQQQTQQAGDTANYQQFQNQQSYPFQTAQFLSSIVGSLAPSLGGTTSGKGSSTTSPPNYLTQLLGLGTAGLGALSDSRAKRDIEPVGKLFDGTNIYRFKYHGDPRTHIGVMAQEVEKDTPHAVGTGLDGLKRVDYKTATDDAADAGHFANGGFAMGGMPYSTGSQQQMGYVPAPVNISSSGTKQPSLPSAPTSQSTQQQQQASQQQTQALTKFGSALAKSPVGQDIKGAVLPASMGGNGSTDPSSSNFIGPPVPTTTPDMAVADAIPASGAASTGDAFSGLGSLFSHGGLVKGYDDGGGVPLDDAPPVPVVPTDPLIPAKLMDDGGDSVLQQPIVPQAAPPVPPMSAPVTIAPPPPVAAAADDTPAPVQVASNDPTHVPSLGDIFRSAEQKYGLPSGYLAHTANTESSFDPNAHNDSGAAGLFQFMPATAKQYGLSNPYDPIASTDAAARLAADNYATLKAGLNRDPTSGELYLAHQQGAKGAIALLNHPDDPAASMVGKAAVSQNGGNAGMSSAQFVAKWAPDSPVVPQDGKSALAYDAALTKANNSTLPSEITKGRADSASPPVPADATASATAPVTPKQAEKESKMWKSLIPGMSDEMRMGLISAGFGMMASTSPNFGVGVGQGALQGMTAYQKAQELSRQGDLAKAQIANLGAETQSHQAETASKKIANDAATDNLATTRGLRTEFSGNNGFMQPPGQGAPAAAPAAAPPAQTAPVAAPVPAAPATRPATSAPAVIAPANPGAAPAPAASAPPAAGAPAPAPASAGANAPPASTIPANAPAVTAAVDADPKETVAVAQKAAATAVGVQNTPSGPVPVDKAGQPVMDPRKLLYQAQRYLTSGVPSYVTAGTQLMDIYKRMVPEGATLDQSGSIMPAPGYLPFEQAKEAATEKDRTHFMPAGNVITSDGSVHPLILDAASGKTIDAVTQQPLQAGDKVQPKTSGSASKNDPDVIKKLADGIVSGNLPPTTTRLYSYGAPVQATLQERGFNLEKAQREESAAQKQIASLNGPQMIKFVGLAHSVDNTIDEVSDLAKQMNQSGIPALNKLELSAFVNAEGNSDKGQLATRYITAVNTLKEEFTNLAQGGYAPTEAAWKLGNEQINGNYGVKQLQSSLGEVQRLVRYRINAIPGLNENGPGAANRYTGQTGQQPAAAPPAGSTAAPAATPPATAAPSVGDTKMFKQGLGRWNGKTWEPAS